MTSLPDFAKATPLPEPPSGWHDYWYAVSHDGALTLVRVDRDFSGVSPREHHLAWSTTRLRLSVLKDGVEANVLVTTASRWPRVERLADGRCLVIAERAEDGERNARLVDGNGLDVLIFEVGDNVRSLIGTTGGAIWAGYGDEATGGPPPAGCGIASFNADGECRWLFEEDYEVLDCYAMSASHEDVWACTYDEFPIIRIRDGEIKFWENDLRGAGAIAADGEYIILAGGYPTFEGIAGEATDDRIALLRLDDRRAAVIAEMRVPQIAEHDAFLMGRDGVLHIVVGGSWTKLSVKEWVSALG